METQGFDELLEKRLGEIEGGASDADAGWLTGQVDAALAAGGAKKNISRAIHALARVGPQQQLAAVNWLGALATGPHRQEWSSLAVSVLQRFGGVPACQARLLDFSRDSRLSALERGSLACSVGPAGVPALAAALAELPGSFRWGSTALILDFQRFLLSVRRAEPDPLALLGSQYERANWVVRGLLLDAIEPGVAEPARVARWIARMGQRGDPRTRRAAAAALGRLGHPSGRPWLEAQLTGEEAGVRREARASLARLSPGEAANGDEPDGPGPQQPLPTLCPAWAALPPAPRWVPPGFWLSRLARTLGLGLWLPLGVIALGAWHIASEPRRAQALVASGLMMLLGTLAFFLWPATSEARLVRSGFASLGRVGEGRLRVSERKVRGSTIRIEWYEYLVQLLGDDGRLHAVELRLERRIDAGEELEPILHEPGDPSRAVILRGLDDLRVDSRGRLRFKWGVRPVAAVALLLVLVAISARGLLPRLL